MTLNNNLYNKNIVNKPWGEEYTIYKDRSKLAVTLVKINSGKKTSLHCHPKKKTGFIILKGKPIVQVGIHKDNKWQTKPLSILVLRPGLFHSLSNEDTLKKDVYAFEFETPYDKKDLVRFKDEYGRSEKGYENSKSFKKFDNNTLIFKNSKKKKIYNFFGRKITLQQLEHINDIKKLNNNSVTGILKGNLVDKKKQVVLNYGEIVKTKTLKVLIKKFTIQNNLFILNIS